MICGNFYLCYLKTFTIIVTIVNPCLSTWILSLRWADTIHVVWRLQNLKNVNITLSKGNCYLGMYWYWYQFWVYICFFFFLVEYKTKSLYHVCVFLADEAVYVLWIYSSFQVKHLIWWINFLGHNGSIEAHGSCYFKWNNTISWCFKGGNWWIHICFLVFFLYFTSLVELLWCPILVTCTFLWSALFSWILLKLISCSPEAVPKDVKIFAYQAIGLLASRMPHLFRQVLFF